MLLKSIRLNRGMPQAAAFASSSRRNGLIGRWTRRSLILLAVLLSVTAFAPLLPVDWWWVRIGDFPRLQLLIAYCAALAMLLPFLRRRWAQGPIAVLVASAAIQLYWIFPYLPLAPHQVETAKSTNPDVQLTILVANVLQSNDDSQALLTLVEQMRPDVLVLCEVNQKWIDRLSSLKDAFAFHLEHPLENEYGIALYSQMDTPRAEVRAMVKAEIPSIDADIRLRSGHRVRLFAVHPNPPRPGEDTTKRDAELVLVGREVRDDISVIVVGDLNDVGWSRTTNLFQEVSRLLDPRRGRGFYATFDADSYIWRYPLDYVFHSDDFRVTELKVLPYIGSDHFPLWIQLSHEPAARATQEAPSLDPDDREDAQRAVDAVR
jgi:endonuclease/exonuclease/phosphatase (EEP) superfamily protein YafD